MASDKQVLRITAEQWNAQKARGLVARIDYQPYIVLTHPVTGEPAYQRVVIVEAESNRELVWAEFLDARRQAQARGRAKAEQASEVPSGAPQSAST